MLVRLFAAALLFTTLAVGARAEPRPLSSEELDRVSAGASASATLTVGEMTPQLVPEPPRNPREFWRWLRFRLICSLPGRICIQ